MNHGACLLALILSSTGLVRAAESFDVVVYGGTPGGIVAAVAAARSGATTVLLEQTRHVGGLSTSGVNTSEIEHMLEETYGGIALEFYQRLGRAYGFDGQPLYRWESHVAERVFNEMLQQAGVTVQLEKFVLRVTKAGPRLTRIDFTDGTAATGKCFIDATYEGDLLARAGVTYAVGRESIQHYDEPLAGGRLFDKEIDASPYADNGELLPGFIAPEGLVPGAADKKVMNYNFRLTVSKAADRVPFPQPEPYDPNRFAMLARYLAKQPQTTLKDLIDLYAHPSGQYKASGNGRLQPVPTEKWEMNNKQNAIISLGHFGGQFDWPEAAAAQRRAIFADHKNYTQGLLWFLGHDPAVPPALRRETLKWGLADDEYTDNAHWPYYLYVREARRMVGRYVMTQHDVQTNRQKDDAIALGSHWIDCHHVQRIATSRTGFKNEGRIWVTVTQPYQIPYRSLTPQAGQCDNLLVPVALSASHVAFCSLRLESTWMMLGHAAGAAAAQCVKHGCPVQQLDVKTLQRQLATEKQVIAIPTNAAAPAR